MLSEKSIGRYFASGILSALLASHGPQAIAQQAAHVLDTQPESVYQGMLADIANAPSSTARLQQVDRLQAFVMHLDYSKLVSQLLWYAAHDQGDAPRRRVVGLVLKAIDIPRQSMVTALVPHLDERDEAIRRVTENLLKGYEDESVERPPDFSIYRGIIESDVLAGRAPQISLIRRMYAIDPGAALIALMRAYQVRDPDQVRSVRWTEHSIAELLWKRRYGFVDSRSVSPEAAAELEKLSRHDAWWARLYVANVIAQHSEMSNGNLIARLRTDENQLVRESVQGLVSK